MKWSISLALLGALSLLPQSAPADPVIYLNVSFKAIVDPATGQPAPYVTNDLVNEVFRFGNQMLEKYQRGYRLRNAEQTPFILIGGSSHPNDPSTWYPFKYFPNLGGPMEEAFRQEASVDFPAMYQWNFSALNIFLTTGFGGGWCATCTGRESDYIANGSGQNPIPGFTAEQVFASHILHETGHYFGLSHTHGALCGDQATGVCAAPPRPVDGDGMASTAPDISNITGCLCNSSIDDLSQLNYGFNHSELDQAHQDLISDTWFNLMSYHERHGFSRLTDEQLDRWTDFSNSTRGPFVSGQTWFVDGAAGCAAPFGNSACIWGGPFATVADGVERANAAGGDIVLIRAGSYNEPGIINKAVSLRASRGTVIIGR